MEAGRRPAPAVLAFRDGFRVSLGKQTGQPTSKLMKNPAPRASLNAQKNGGQFPSWNTMAAEWTASHF